MRIKSHAPSLYLSMAAAGVVTLAFIGTYTYLMWADGRAGMLVAIFVTPFLLVGSSLAFFGTRSFVRQAWFGSWQLEIPDEGCLLGRTASVTLHPRRATTLTEALQCRLRCVRFVPRRDSHSPSGSNVSPLWQSSWSVAPTALDPTRGLELSLPFPETGEPTRIDRKGGANVVWQLNVVITSAEGSEEPVFDLPVRV